MKVAIDPNGHVAYNWVLYFPQRATLNQTLRVLDDAVIDSVDQAVQRKDQKL